MKKSGRNTTKVSKNTKTVKTTAKKKGKAATKVALENLAKRKSKKVKKSVKKMFTKKKYPTRHYSDIGAEGEQQIYNWLVSIFGANCVFRNVYVMKSTGYLTEIDLLAVHPTGVYVVESKNYSGLVVGDSNEKDWVQIKGNGYQRKFYSPVMQNAGHIDALREACYYHLGFVPPMLSLLVFPDRCNLQVTNLPVGLRCCRLSQLYDMLRNIFKVVSPALTTAQVNALAVLYYQSQRCMLPESVQKEHIKHVNRAKTWGGSK